MFRLLCVCVVVCAVASLLLLCAIALFMMMIMLLPMLRCLLCDVCVYDRVAICVVLIVWLARFYLVPCCGVVPRLMRLFSVSVLRCVVTLCARCSVLLCAVRLSMRGVVIDLVIAALALLICS